MENAPLTESILTIEAILAAFAPAGQPYQRAAVDAALQQRETIIPYLIQVLERALADPTGQENLVDHIYALLLLGHFRASQAHEVIVKLLRLPKMEDWADYLFGDLITEDMPMVLLRTSGESLEQIQALILDRQAEEFCRGAGVRALTYAVADGMISRESALEFLGGLLVGDEADDEDSAFWSQIAVSMNHLYPSAWIETLRSAFARDLIDEWVIKLEDIEQELETRSAEEAIQAVRAEMRRFALDDIHATMQGWVMFNQPIAETTTSRTLSTLTVVDPLKRKKDAAARSKKKQKRKIATTSRKKNRRKK